MGRGPEEPGKDGPNWTALGKLAQVVGKWLPKVDERLDERAIIEILISNMISAIQQMMQQSPTFLYMSDGLMRKRYGILKGHCS